MSGDEGVTPATVSVLNQLVQITLRGNGEESSTKHTGGESHHSGTAGRFGDAEAKGGRRREPGRFRSRRRGADAGSSRLTAGRERRVILALRNGILGTGVVKLIPFLLLLQGLALAPIVVSRLQSSTRSGRGSALLEWGLQLGTWLQFHQAPRAAGRPSARASWWHRWTRDAATP